MYIKVLNTPIAFSSKLLLMLLY